MALKIGNKATGSAKQIKLKLRCSANFEVEIHGELTPRISNGRAIGSAPSTIEFEGSPSGELESAVGISTFTGKLKVLGYEGQDLITVKNP